MYRDDIIATPLPRPTPSKRRVPDTAPGVSPVESANRRSRKSDTRPAAADRLSNTKTQPRLGGARAGDARLPPPAVPRPPVLLLLHTSPARVFDRAARSVHSPAALFPSLPSRSMAPSEDAADGAAAELERKLAVADDEDAGAISDSRRGLGRRRAGGVRRRGGFQEEEEEEEEEEGRRGQRRGGPDLAPLRAREQALRRRVPRGGDPVVQGR